MTARDHQARGLLVSGRFPELEDALCERVQELRRGRPLAPLTVVVGSSHVRTRVGDLLVRRLGAVANVSVVTLGRLAADLVAAARGAPQATLAGLSRERLLRRLIAARRLAYFAPVQDRPHFPQAVAATFADLREACIAPASPWSRIALGQSAPDDAPSGAAKAADLRDLYSAYCGELAQRGLADGAQQLLDAAAAVSSAGGPAHARVLLYGIYDLNQAQEALVAGLLDVGADLFVPIPRGGSGAGASALEAALAAGLAEQRREAPPAETNLDRLADLWCASRPLDAPVVAFRPEDDTLTVASVPDERAEMREAARTVLAAVTDGAESWDCAVVVPHGDDVERAAVALEAAGLPVACRRADRSDGPRLLLRLADCLAPPAGKPFARRAVVDLLSAAPLRDSIASQHEIALWLDEARQAGVVSGLEQWRDRVARRRRGLERRLADLEARGVDLDSDDEVAEKLDTVRLRRVAARSLEAAAGALGRACGGLPSRAGWGQWAGAIRALAEALFEPPVAAAVGDAVGRLAALDVLDEEVDVSDMTSALRAQLADARVPQGRVGREGVAVLTPLETRGLRFHTVVFTGLAEGGFPSRGRPDPLLGDAARHRLAEALGVRLPLAESRDAESTLLFAFACEAARERLTLLAPRTDAATGRERIPSRLLLRLASLAVGRPVGLDAFKTGKPLAAVWRLDRVDATPSGASGSADDVLWLDAHEYDTAALLALSARRAAPAAQKYLGAVLEDQGAAERRLSQWRSAREKQPGAWDGLLGGEARAALAARHPFDAEMSPTRLERYVGCPFAFLLRDVLGLEAPEEPGESLEMDAREFGTLAHKILQVAFSAAIAGESGLDETLQALAAAWETACAEAELGGVTGAALSWAVRRAMLLEDLLECVRRDPVFATAGDRPVDVEWVFGETAGRIVSLELPGGRTVRFKGRVDRLDATAAGARIIDYKTGKGTTEAKRLKDGLGVQLPVYQLAVRQAGEADYRKIACLYRLVTRRGGFEELSLPDDEEATGRRLRGLVTQAAALVDAGLFPRSTAGRCDYCDVGYACGATDWTRGRKREHELLADLVGLQRNGPQEVSDDAGA
jgi:ATP-dependent helicase/nuclease subunit B